MGLFQTNSVEGQINVCFGCAGCPDRQEVATSFKESTPRNSKTTIPSSLLLTEAVPTEVEFQLKIVREVNLLGFSSREETTVAPVVDVRSAECELDNGTCSLSEFVTKAADKLAADPGRLNMAINFGDLNT